MHQVDIVAALVAALAGFVIGGLWYGAMFQKPWMRHSGMSFERGRQQNKLLVFGGAYVLNAIAAAAALRAVDDQRRLPGGQFCRDGRDRRRLALVGRRARLTDQPVIRVRRRRVILRPRSGDLRVG
jgi:hypothetical protein